MGPDDKELEKARFFFELVLKSDETLQKSNDRLNEKVRALITVSATLIPIVIGLGYFILKQTTAYWVFIPFFLSLVMFLLSIVLGMFLQRPNDFLFLNPQFMIDKYNEETLTYIVNKSASTWSDIVVLNKDVINSKENGLKSMLILMCVGLTILAVTFLMIGIVMWN